ncbi:M48 family metalloprotease [Actinoplanes sp. NPDC051859]|uniref:M48 family metalloprotease n=1 Tax=Actinoplanes sp. NPDC051859 TaxID=3363909 RepID=UPI0037A07619
MTHRIAWRLTEGQFRTLTHRPLTPRSFTAARATILVVAVLLLLLVAAFAAGGLWLIAYDFPRLTILPGLALLGLAVALRPRFGGVASEVHVLTEEQAPELFALISRVATALGAPMPHIVGFDSGLGAYTTTIGLRRWRTLVLGVPLWTALDPQERVALVGHELGHFVNGDIRRLPLEHMALSTLAHLAHLTRPSRSGYDSIIDLLVGLVQGAVSRVILGLHLLVTWVGLRDSQRAEYLADDLAARAAGSRAAVGLLDSLLVTDALDTVLRREARAQRSGAAWHEAARQARTSQAEAIPLLRQLSRREEVSLFASHPPSGLRAAMLEQRPQHAAQVTLTESQSARIDDEIAIPTEQACRDLATAL